MADNNTQDSGGFIRHLPSGKAVFITNKRESDKSDTDKKNHHKSGNTVYYKKEGMKKKAKATVLYGSQEANYTLQPSRQANLAKPAPVHDIPHNQIWTKEEHEGSRYVRKKGVSGGTGGAGSGDKVCTERGKCDKKGGLSTQVDEDTIGDELTGAQNPMFTEEQNHIQSVIDDLIESLDDEIRSEIIKMKFGIEYDTTYDNDTIAQRMNEDFVEVIGETEWNADRVHKELKEIVKGLSDTQEIKALQEYLQGLSDKGESSLSGEDATGKNEDTTNNKGGGGNGGNSGNSDNSDRGNNDNNGESKPGNANETQNQYGTGTTGSQESTAGAEQDRKGSVNATDAGVSLSDSEYKAVGDDLGIDWSKYKEDEFIAGMKDEQNHLQTVNGEQSKVAEIVMAHLDEDALYYTHFDQAKKAGIMKTKEAEGKDVSVKPVS